MHPPNVIVTPERFQLAVGVNEDCVIEITNVGFEAILFRLLTTSPNRYIVKHTKGVVQGNSTVKVVVTLNPANIVEETGSKLKDDFRIEYAVLGKSDVVEPRLTNVAQLINAKKAEDKDAVLKKMLRCHVILESNPTSSGPTGGGSHAVMAPAPRAGSEVEGVAGGRRMTTKEMEATTLEKKRRREGDGAVHASRRPTLTTRRVLLVIAALTVALGVWLMME